MENLHICSVWFILYEDTTYRLRPLSANPESNQVVPRLQQKAKQLEEQTPSRSLGHLNAHQDVLSALQAKDHPRLLSFMIFTQEQP